ncbi:hypothetical protein YPPY66_4929 [Yersinia pestis PY-66]|uniref:Uncharacterized protein n=1 Tax=Yersinia pestis PY-08 TaxID=992134 RepID=A0AB72ZDR5_YERPE|nr:hypothetical protein YPPY01_4507 [Yersinia pestis PY-01]EIQ83355.1 hypothetical protein YPPY02_4564 [Yersinia pestis PY-02]EIQ83490.1 hypothetical protein YPPY03_4643 [Yersinia pestis PY-03]EIQ96569.1 hypothetical protein YPPY04_4574 [Yersinia pestis PY-04]EIQ97901.1 hypothetical protein YPPY05_4549 [Yersinia pestis PY-05]EIR00936.1 hypothetical protein YPPY06_4611 [Yersinia pestis PY-06]EIR12152.1 hypothetical protein YPPY08_4636 [Yersinia pestis PY-08]EIR26960.1 hypothetical protein YPP
MLLARKGKVVESALFITIRNRKVGYGFLLSTQKIKKIR